LAETIIRRSGFAAGSAESLAPMSSVLFLTPSTSSDSDGASENWRCRNGATSNRSTMSSDRNSRKNLTTNTSSFLKQFADVLHERLDGPEKGHSAFDELAGGSSSSVFEATFESHSDVRARRSNTAAKTASFFKEFADVLHERMDGFEIFVETEIETLKGSYNMLVKDRSTAKNNLKARKRTTAAKTANFFKEFADVLHERMDGLETHMQTQIEALKGSHKVLVEQLAATQQVQRKHEDRILALDEVLSRLDLASNGHAQAHQHHITAIQNLEIAVRSLFTSGRPASKFSIASDMKVKACEAEGVALNEPVTSSVEPKQRSMANGTSGASVVDLCKPALLDLGARMAAVEAECKALQGHCLSAMMHSRDLDEKLTRQSTELVSVKPCCPFALGEEAEGKQLQFDLSHRAACVLTEQPIEGLKEADKACKDSPDTLAYLAALSMFKLSDPKRWHWLMQHHALKLEALTPPANEEQAWCSGESCSNEGEGTTSSTVVS